MNPTHSIRFTVQFSDIDAAGVVNNAKYFTYFENARVEQMLSVLGKREIIAERYGFVVAHAEIDYKYPARFRNMLRIDLKTASVGNTSWVTEYEIYKEDDERLIATGKTVQVAFDFKEGKPIPIPQEVKEKLAQEVEKS